MKRPCTSQPASLRSSAATAESTPPESPTMTRAEVAGTGRIALMRCARSARQSNSVLWPGVAQPGSDAQRITPGRACALEVERRDGPERQAPAGQVVPNTAQDERTAQPPLPLLELRGREPARADDPPIELLPGVVIGDRADEGETQRAAAVGGIAPQVDAEQCARLKAPGGLLAHLAHHGRVERLAPLDVTGGLVDDQAVVDALLDEEQAAGRLRDGRDGDVRTRGHGEDYSRRGNATGAMQASAAARGA